MSTLWQDVVYAVRGILRSPGYAAVTLLTLALGIGANTAIFSVVHGVLLRPLSYPNPERLMFITSQFTALNFDKFWVSVPEYLEFRNRNRSFSGVGAYREGAVNVGGYDRPRRVNSAVVTHDLLTVLGVQPRYGRLFTEEDTRPGAEDIVIISDALWRSDFGTDQTLVGRTIAIDGSKMRVVGIMPPGFDLHDERVDVWLPIGIDPKNVQSRSGHFLYLVGRLKDQVSLDEARRELEGMLAAWKPEFASGTHAPNLKTHRLQFTPLHAELVGGMARAIWVLQGAVGFVLLIACANMANLLLVRAGARQKEFAIRSALGAGRWRLVRHFLTEAVLLSLVGGALGVLVAIAALRGLLAVDGGSLPRSAEISLDVTVLLFGLAVSLLTGFLFGLAPLVQLRERIVTLSLKEGGTRGTAAADRMRVRRALVVTQVALAIVLVAGAGLLLRSLANITAVDSGFNRDRMVTFGLVLPRSTYQSAQSTVDFFGRLIGSINELPGVTGTAAMTGLPPVRAVLANDVDFENYMAPKEGPFENVDYFQTVTVDYLKTMGINVTRGRGFEPSDATGGPVVLINEALANTFFKDRDPVGQRVNPFFGPKAPPWFTIVGVVRDVKQGGVAERTGTELYFLFEQGPRLTNFAPASMNVVIRSPRGLDSLAPEISRLVQAADPGLPIVRMRTMDDVFAEAVSRPRLLASLLGAFAGFALLLAAMGTYGMLSYTVTERRKEIGIHMALGASRLGILGMLLSAGLRVTIMGVIVGLAGALWLTRLLQTQLFEVKATDPATLAVVVACVMFVALLASYLPASRAMSLDPMRVLRED